MESLACFYCEEDFDSEEHPPLTLICNHTLCKACVQDLQKQDNCVICPKCEPVTIRNSDIKQVVADYRDFEQFTVDNELLDLSLKKKSCFCHLHNKPAIGLDKKNLDFVCENDDHKNLDIEKNFKIIKALVYSQLVEQTEKFNIKNVEKLNIPAIEYENLKAVNLEIFQVLMQKFEKCKKFIEENGEIFKIIEKIAFFKKISDKKKLSIKDKILFLQMKKQTSELNAKEFIEEYNECKKVFKAVLNLSEVF